MTKKVKIPRASSLAVSGRLLTPLPQLNTILGGGFPIGRVSEISGKWSVGKTTLALMIVAEAQRQGVDCVWFDAEWAWDDVYAKALGVNTDTLGLVQEEFAEDGLDKLLEFIRETKKALVVIDAIGALHPREEAEKTSGERTIGSQSALVSRLLRKAVPLLAINKNTLVVLNHEFIPIMATPGRPTIMTSGGRKLEYHRSIWLSLSRVGKWLKRGEEYIGFIVKAEVRKNKTAPTEKKSCELQLRIGSGFSPEADLLREAVEGGVVEKRGRLFWFGKEKLGFENAARKHLEENPELVEKIKHALP